ncbi:MAG: copper chaperone PCu(A)C [Candidatus Caldarchaeum sp.]|nr:copper chaperone PCu(A)C [Candidatus Caldarchaeum sp.]MDW8435265.1 copper chaperone PCu(A)C [Candidatus Caldarchaeum sp.]
MKLIYIVLGSVLAVAVVLGVYLVFVPAFEVSDVTMRKGTQAGGIFLNLHNRGLFRDCVVDAEVIGEGRMGEVKLKTELHKTVMEKDVMKMVRVDRICVDALSTVKMRGVEGEGYHIMVFGDLDRYESFHVHLKMESGRVIHFDVTAPEHAKDGHGHKH